MIAVRRPGRRRFRRSRGVPGDRLPADVRQRRQVGGADRSRRAHSRIRRARLSHRDVRPARARSCSRCPRTCCRRAPTCADAPRVDAGRARRRIRRCVAAAASGSPRRSGRSCSSAAAAGTPAACAALRDVRRSAARCRSPARSATRTSSTTGIRTTPATSASASTRKLAARVRDADVLLVIGERLGEMTTSGYTLLDAARARADADPRASRAPTSSAASTSPRWRSPRRPARSSRRSTRCGAARRPARRAPRRRARRLRRVAGAAAGARRRSTSGRSCAGSTQRLPDDAILTNGAGNYSTWLHRLYRYRGFRTQLAPYVGSMGYGVPAAVAAKAVHPRAHRASRGTATAAS